MPLTEGIIAGLIANGLTELIRYASIELGSREEINRSVVEELQGDKELETALRKAIVAVAKEVNLQNDRATEKLLLFLISPEAEAIVRQIYGIWLTSAGGSKTESELRTEFTLLMALYLGSGAVEIQEVANELFRALTAGCELALKKSIAKGVLAAHEAKSEHRFRFLADELATIERNLELL